MQTFIENIGQYRSNMSNILKRDLNKERNFLKTCEAKIKEAQFENNAGLERFWTTELDRTLQTIKSIEKQLNYA